MSCREESHCNWCYESSEPTICGVEASNLAAVPDLRHRPPSLVLDGVVDMWTNLRWPRASDAVHKPLAPLPCVCPRCQCLTVHDVTSRGACTCMHLHQSPKTPRRARERPQTPNADIHVATHLRKPNWPCRAWLVSCTRSALESLSPPPDSFLLKFICVTAASLVVGSLA